MEHGSIVRMMEQLLSAIPVTFSDPQINSLLRDTSVSPGPYKRHYTQNEEFMLRLPKSYTVDSYPIHHDVRKTQPGPEYLGVIRGVFAQLAEQMPSV